MPEEYERREYPNPPIAEALCQVTFARPLSWSVATPGLLWEQLRAEYPTEPEAQDQIAASVQIGDASPNVSVNRGEPRYLYADAEKQRLVVANSGFVSANSVPPYEGWPALRGRLESAISALQAIVPLQPVASVALRYINRIVLPAAERIETDVYFRINIRTAREGSASFRNFMHRVESILDDDGTLLISTFATMPPTENGFPVLLDLDVQRPGLNTTDISEVLEIAEYLHDVENREFESAITDETRKLFN